MTRSRDIADQQENLGGAVAPFVAGKNKIINGDFGIWQRGTSFNTSGAYTADRWVPQWNGTPTLSISQQTFTPGTAPVAGYESTYFMRLNVTTAGSGATFLLFAQQKIEDVRTFAGQTATFSIWAKSSTSVNVGLGVRQNFGSGGSAEQYPSVTDITGPQTTGVWKRLVYNITFPSITGKTIGTGSFVAIDIYSNGINTVHQVDIWGAQLESGNVATPFTTASGSIGGELALCRRYYWRQTASQAYDIFGIANANATTATRCAIPTPGMRAVPTSADYGGTIGIYDGVSMFTATTISISSEPDATFVTLNVLTAATLTQFRTYWIIANNSSTAYIGFSAEL